MALVLCSLAVIGGACSTDTAKHRHYTNGERFFEAGKFKEAVLEFRNAVALDEQWGEARYKLAEAHAATGNPEAALRQYVRAADLMPDSPAAQLKAATYLLIVGQYEDAKARAQQVLNKDPKNVEALIVLGNTLAGLRDLDGAITQLTEAVELDPSRSRSYTNLALIRVAQGRLDEARTAFEKAVDIDDKSIAAWLALASFRWSLGDAAGTAQSLKRAVEIDSGNVLTNRALATFHIATGNPALAEPHLKTIAETTKSAAGWFALADYYIGNARFDEARQVLEPLAVQATSSAAAETRLAGIAYAAGQTTDAHRMIDKLLERQPNTARALLLKARWLLNEGKPDRALQRAKSAVAASPRMVAAHYILGLAERRTRRTTDAIKSFTEVQRLNPRAAAAQVQLSQLHLSRNAIDSAVLAAEEALSNAPGSLDAWLALVRAWIARKDFERADATLASLTKQAPSVAGVHALEGSLRLMTGNAVAARAAFERALAIDPSSSEALTGITTIDVLSKNMRAARARVEARLAVDPADPELLLLAAKVFVSDGEPSRAEEVLRRAIDLDPLDTATYSLLGRIYADQKRLDTALSEFDQIARREPRNISARVMGAMVVHAQGDLVDATRRYHEILKIEPRAALAANNLAVIYANQGENLDLAQNLAEQAFEQLPARAEIQDTLGWVYYKKQLHGQAVNYFEQSVAADPNNPVYHYHLGLAYSKNGRLDRARVAFQKALELNPRFTDAQHALALLGV